MWDGGECRGLHAGVLGLLLLCWLASLSAHFDLPALWAYRLLLARSPFACFKRASDGDLICCACTRAVGHSYQVPPHINLNGLLGRKNITRRRLDRLIALNIPERRRAGYRRWRHSHSRDLSGAISPQTDIKRRKGMEAGGNTSSRDFKT